MFTDLYKVKWKNEEIPVYFARVSKIPFNTVWPGHQRPIDQTEESGFILIESDGEVTLEITPKESFSSVTVRPLSKGIKTEDAKGVIKATFPLGHYSLECDDFHNALHVFIVPEKDYSKYKNAKNLLYFGEGEHELGLTHLSSDTVVYVEKGARLYANFIAENVKNIAFVGHGIIDGSKEIRTAETEPAPDKNGNFAIGAMRIYESKNIVVDGITFMDSACWTQTFYHCENIEINDIRHIGMWRYNADGIDFINCKNMTVKNSFFRNFDDIIVPNGRKQWEDEVTENLYVENCVMWCDWGRTLELGAITQASEIRNIHYKNLDLIHNMHGAMSLQNRVFADAHDVLYEDIRVEYDKNCLEPKYQASDDSVYTGKAGYMAPLFHAWIYPLPRVEGTGRYGKNHDITLKNINIFVDEGLSKPPVIISGKDENHKTWNIFFEDIYINGKKVNDLSELGTEIGPYAEKVYLK